MLWAGSGNGFATFDFYENAGEIAADGFTAASGRFDLQRFPELKLTGTERIGDGYFSVGVFFFGEDGSFLGETSLQWDTMLGGDYSFNIRAYSDQTPRFANAVSYNLYLSVIGDPGTGAAVDGFSFDSIVLEK